jgi:hexosaminidase
VIRSILLSIALLINLLLSGCTPGDSSSPTSLPMSAADPEVIAAMNNVIPKPVSVTSAEGQFMITESTNIYVEAGSDEAMAIGQYLAEKLRSATGYPLQVLEASGADGGDIHLDTTGADPLLGEEGYELSIASDLVTLTAHQPAGLFRGIQTIRQLLPAQIESSSLQPGPWPMPAGQIRDLPRFAWRGIMLDVARHFATVEDVKRLIDLSAYYKINRFHLHLADDQGWRIMINSWPNLATHGGSTEVGGGPGGYYTQEEYADIVAYAQSRYIMVIPEIDMPGHTNAALSSYPELNCDGVAPALYTGIEVGFSSLCIDKELTYTFLDDVIGELAAITPGPYIHIGGDEAKATQHDDYLRFIERVQAIVQSHGKNVIGWEEIAQSKILPTTVVQHWDKDVVQAAIDQGAKVIMSPASKAYLDMKYDESTDLGLVWAGLTDVKDAYEWDPATQLSGVSEADVLGVEAPLWSETVQNIDDITFMVFPRLPGYAEIGWSPAAGRDWNEYRQRLASHGSRLDALGVNFYKDPLVPWP